MRPWYIRRTRHSPWLVVGIRDVVLRGSRRSCQTDGATELLSQCGPGVGEKPLLGPSRAGRSVGDGAGGSSKRRETSTSVNFSKHFWYFRTLDVTSDEKRFKEGKTLGFTNTQLPRGHSHSHRSIQESPSRSFRNIQCEVWACHVFADAPQTGLQSSTRPVNQ